jgi:hypothetical protein
MTANNYKVQAERFISAINFARTQNLDVAFIATVLEKIEEGKTFEKSVQESLNEWDL